MSEEGISMMLEVKQIHKSFGDLEVLKQVDLQVNKGDVVAILGPAVPARPPFCGA